MGQFKEALKLVRDCKVIDYKVLLNATVHTPADKLDREALMIFKLCDWKYVEDTKGVRIRPEDLF